MYYILKRSGEHQVKIKKSIFLASLKYVENVEQAKSAISVICSKHKTATHNCWAYIVGDNAQTMHFSDNGEPPGTAGKPILNALMQAKLTNVAAVVTRYYGGVKLGVRGLIDAYGSTITTAVEQSILVENIKNFNLAIAVSYDFLEIIKHSLKKFDVKIQNIDYTSVVELKFSVADFFFNETLKLLEEFKGSGKIIYYHVLSG